MITTYLQGGLGNYLFQIAVAHVHALDMGTDSVFSESNAVRVHRPISAYKDNILRNVKFVNSNLGGVKYFEHLKGFNYHELPKSDNLFLNGYYQTEKYIKHRRKEVVELFSPREEDITYINEKYGDLSDTCSIHIRRGDYVNNQNHHPVCSLGYYRSAVSMLPEGTKFLIFSDDIPWCKNNFHGDSFIFVENELDYIDLYLMSMCSHNIIANSTFSWWGAWLNNNKDKMVISPSKWFGVAKHLDTSDIIPENWVKI